MDAEARPRPTISGLMVGVLVVAGALALARNVPRERLYPAVLLILLASSWVAAPLGLRRDHWQAARPDYAAIDPDGPEVPPAVSGRILRATAELAALGFAARGHYVLRDHVPNATAYLSLYEDRRELGLARVVNVVAPIHDVDHPHTAISFTTEFADGSRVVTTDNASDGLAAPTRAATRSASFPGIHEPRTLLAIHRRRVDRSDGAGGRRIPYDEDPIPYLIAHSGESLSAQVRAGLYVLDEDGRVYRLTWKGAVRQAWGRRWPIAPIRRALLRRRAERLLGELGIDIGEGRPTEPAHTEGSNHP